MTREEAKEFLTDISYSLGNMSVEYLAEKDGKKMREAIEALEQQSTADNDLGVDAVSRKDVHDMLENLPITVEDKWFNWLQKACMRLAELPSLSILSEPLFDKIRAEIVAFPITSVLYKKGVEIEEVPVAFIVASEMKKDILEIIDKYRKEARSNE